MRLYFFKAAAFLSACLLFMACEIFFFAHHTSGKRFNLD